MLHFQQVREAELYRLECCRGNVALFCSRIVAAIFLLPLTNVAAGSVIEFNT